MRIFKLKRGFSQLVSHSIPASKILLPVVLLMTVLSISGQTSVDRNFPDDFTSVINVKTRYGARGDGATDDTAALRRAISENVGTSKILYFPAGTYIVSDRLEWRQAQDTARPWAANLTLMGQNQYSTVIRLRDNAGGYDDPSHPKAVIFTASNDYTPRDQSPRPGYSETGIGNEAFGNYIENLTIDAGNNRGAIGIDYLANNTGAVRDVSIRGQGIAGIALIRALQGPELIKKVSIDGFDFGILMSNAGYAATLEYINVSNQRLAGISNQGQNALSIRGLRSNNQVPAVQNSDALSLIDLVDSSLTGGAAGISAIDNRGQLFARNVGTSGYRSAIMHNNNFVDGANVSEWTSAQSFKLFPSETGSLNLPVEDTPEFHDNDFNNWANVVRYGGQPDDLWNDDTAAIQAALNSGKSTVYLPQGVYLIGRTLTVPPSVRRIIGGDWGIAWGTFADAGNPQPLLRIEGNTDQPVIIERLAVSRKHTNANSPLHRGLIIVDHASSRPVVLKDITTATDRIFGSYRSQPGAGKLFIEDVAASQFFFEQPQKVWARQLNPESADELRIRNNAADLWILGIKTEGAGSILENNAGGTTEILGGNLFSTTAPASPLPSAVINNGGRISLSYTTTAYSPWTADYQVQITETRAGETKKLMSGDLPARGYGRILPLYLGYKNFSVPGSSPFGGKPRPAPGIVQAEDFDEGGENISYHDTDPANDGGVGYRASGVDVRQIVGNDSGGTGLAVGWTHGGEWLNYTLNVASTGTYDLSFNIASDQSGGTLHLEDANGKNLTGPVSFGYTGGWNTFRDVVKRSVTLNAGINTYRVVLETGGFDFNSWQTAPSTATSIPDGVYEIEPSNAPGMRLDVAGGISGDGVNVDIYRDINSSGERWRVTHVDGDWCEISPLVAPTRRLDLYGFGTGNGTPIKIWQATGAPNQRWRIVNVGEGIYEITPQYAQHLRLDVSNYGTTDGSLIHAWQPTQATNQRWQFYSQPQQ